MDTKMEKWNFLAVIVIMVFFPSSSFLNSTEQVRPNNDLDWVKCTIPKLFKVKIQQHAVPVLYGAKIISLRKWMHVYVSKANRSEVLAVLNLINRGANQTFL